MRRVLPSVFVCLVFVSSPALGDIVYSGSQNVTLSVDPMMPVSSQATIEIAGSSGEWDDFAIVLSSGAMMDMMGSLTHLVIYAPGSMSMGGMGVNFGGIVGLGELASNLDAGAEIGPSSSLTDGYRALLTGPGEFGEAGGYIGLMMDSPLNGRHYGWLHMLGQSGIGTDSPSATFDGWAYETDPDAPIAAGDIDVVPLPGAVLLGLLGFGTVGAVRTRRRLKA